MALPPSSPTVAAPHPSDDHHADRGSVAPLSAELKHEPAHHGPARWAGFLAAALGLGALMLPWLGGDEAARRVAGVPQGEPGLAELPVAQEVPPPLTPTSRPRTDVPAPEAVAPPESELPFALDFDEETARRALAHRAKAASACAKSRRTGGKVPVEVTFSPSGVSTRAHVTTRSLASTAMARCLEAKLVGVTIPAFRGGKERKVALSVSF